MANDLLIHELTRRSLEQYKQKPTHALMLVGRAGLGKTLIALQLIADFLNIPSENVENYAYFRHLRPEKGTLGIEMVRELGSFFSRKVPGRQSLNRFVLIDSAETLTQEASNALLKLLEEPPEHSMIILTTSNIDRILPTIKSRTEIHNIAVPTKADVVQYFAQAGHDMETVQRAWLLSGGSVSATSALLDDREMGASSLDDVKRILSAEPFERLILADRMAKDKAEAANVVALLAQTAEASIEKAAKAGKTTAQRWYRVLQAAEQASDALAKNGNAKLVLTELMLSL